MKNRILILILLFLSLSFIFVSLGWSDSKPSKIEDGKKRKYKVIEASKIEKQVARLKNLTLERQHLQKRLRKVGEWLPIWLQIKKDINAEEVLKQFHKRLAEIKKQEQELRKGVPVWNPPGNPPLSENMTRMHPSRPFKTPFRRRQDREIPPLPELPTVVTGVIERPTYFYAYKWGEPAAGWGNENDFKWNLLRRSDQSPNHPSWVGNVEENEAHAIAFGGWLINTKNGSPARYSDSMSVILCLVYKFPAPQYDSVIKWYAQLKTSLRGIGVWGDGSVSLQPVVSVTDEIGISSFWWLDAYGYDESFNYTHDWDWNMAGIIDAPAGKVAKLTIGISVQLSAMDPPFEANVGYIGDSRGQTHTGETSDIDTDTIRRDGIFRVHFDTGRTGSEFIRYLPGIPYCMVPMSHGDTEDCW
jgi:hypothetical protein